jgi:protein SCO1/2
MGNKIPIVIILGVAASFVLGATALLVIAIADRATSELPILAKVPQFEFTRQDGTPFGLNEMMGKVCVVDFFFTSCPDLCPVMNGNMARLYHKFDGSDKVQFVSISVDPDRDSLEALRKYAASFGVDDDRWVFLRQAQADVARLSEKGFMLAAVNLPYGHSSKFILVDDMGQIRGYYDGDRTAGMNQLSKDIAILARAIK